MTITLWLIVMSVAHAEISPNGSVQQEIDAVHAEGRFSAAAGDRMLDLMDQTKDGEIKDRAAHAFYILFYDLRGVEAEAEAYLLSSRIQERFERALIRDDRLAVRRAFAQTGQVMIQLFSPEAKSRVLAIYSPLFIAALSDPAPEQRQELLAALENMAESGALRDAASRRDLVLAAERERDPDVHARLMDLLASLGAP